jgi:DNA polymerase-3 subunit alpha
VRIHLETRQKVQVLRLGPDLRVNPSPALFGDLKVLLGPTCLEV